MRTTIIAAVMVTILGTVHAQGPDTNWFNNQTFKMNDGHSITLREDGKVDYDGRFMFERCNTAYATDKYIPLMLVITNERGDREVIYAAVELHEVNSNGKVWFTIYEGPLGGMRQSFFTPGNGLQAKL